MADSNFFKPIGSGGDGDGGDGATINVVVVFDTSGSTASCHCMGVAGFPKQTLATYHHMARALARQMMDLATKTGKIVNFRVVFFSSPSGNHASNVVPGTTFDSNMYTTMLGVDSLIDPLVAAAAKRCGHATHTWRGIEAVATMPELSGVVKSGGDVYIVTDGQMSTLTTSTNNREAAWDECAKQFLRVIDINPNVKFNLIAVEDTASDPTNEAAAPPGGDVYKMTQAMTVRIRAAGNEGFKFPVASFKAYNPAVPNGVTLIELDKLPPNHAQWGDRMFNLDDEGVFLVWLRKHVATIATPAEANAFLQSLALVVRQIAEATGQNERGIDRLINRVYGPLLLRIELDVPGFSPELLLQMFQTNVTNGLAGAVAAAGDFTRAKYDLFDQATQNMANHGAIAAAGGGSKCFTVPVLDTKGDLVVIYGPAGLATEDVVYQARVPNGGVRIGDNDDDYVVIPCIGVGDTINTASTRQVVRQLLRGAASQLKKGLDVRSDAAMFWVLERLVSLVRAPGIDAEISDRARELMKTMLRKNLTRVDRELYQHLLEGNALPGEWEQSIRQALGPCNPKAVWRAICLAIGEKFDHAQRKHHSDVDPAAHRNVTLIRVAEAAGGRAYNYDCMITLEDLTDVGGFAPKGGSTDLIAREVLEDLLRRGQPCPIRRTRVTIADFDWVDPVPAEARRVPLTADDLAEKLPKVAVHAERFTKYLVLPRGPVGAGKTATRLAMQKLAHANRVVMDVVSMDDACRLDNGNRQPIKETIKRFVAAPNGGNVRVLYADLCNEHKYSGKLFDITIPPDVKVIEFYPGTGLPVTAATRTAKQARDEMHDFAGFMNWSLQNVLNRPAMSRESTYCLNPVGASRAKCIEVHQMKSKALFHDSISALDAAKAAAYAPPSVNKVAADVLRLVLQRPVASLDDAAPPPAIVVQHHPAAAAAAPAAAAAAAAPSSIGGVVYMFTGEAASTENVGGDLAVVAHLRTKMPPGAKIIVCSKGEHAASRCIAFVEEPSMNKALVLINLRLPKLVAGKQIPAGQKRIRVFVGDADEPNLHAVDEAYAKMQ